MSWREKLLDYPAYRFPRCAFPWGGPRQRHPAGKWSGLLCPFPFRRDGEGCPLPTTAGVVQGCGVLRAGGTAEGRGGAEMRWVPAAPGGTGDRVAASSLAADFKVKCVRFLTLTKGRRKER